MGLPAQPLLSANPETGMLTAALKTLTAQSLTSGSTWTAAATG